MATKYIMRIKIDSPDDTYKAAFSIS